jgi:hypothetical protein
MRKTTIEEKREVKRTWNRNNVGKVRECRRRWNEKNREKLNQWAKEHPDKRAETMRKYRKKHPEFGAIYSRVQRRVNNGTLPKPGRCSICGKQGVRIEGHHFDYSLPYALTWTCRQCHKIIHRKPYEEA